MMKTEIFRIRPYGWQELALLYSPELQPDSATRRLRRWVNHNPALKQELCRLGWRPYAHLLTPVQVEVIVRCLGEP